MKGTVIYSDSPLIWMELLPLQLLEATKPLQYDNDKNLTLRDDFLGEETQQNKQKLQSFDNHQYSMKHSTLCQHPYCD
jgi:hypothetical protein